MFNHIIIKYRRSSLTDGKNTPNSSAAEAKALRYFRQAKTPRSLSVLGLDITVTDAVLPGLSATIESRSGQHVLRMFDPVPRGYVI
jgi:hypothetical protein